MGYVASVLRPDHAIAAVGIDGHLIGVAGFRSRQGAFVFGALADLRAYYGWAGALRRAFLLSLIHNDIDNHRFLVDGIAVDEASRGQGVGTSLIEALCDRARASGYAEIRLDVVGWNIRARSLYERRGFIARGSARSSLTSLLFGFSRAITMTRTL
jgi:ribosomal protein S18 acetylase RimI-like enzyme